ncbi:hypothetical protein CVT26_006799 [Gymnopilus dilepis]|uniref:Heterokaryon incompatibility domain-containing protein n=1 Tax=Gymnopilus dilepis TaxID=231916 RepID=A0A409Y324_9AGAR|nr:hypothetical protein CVT26_006799 [Gymnopilus dilepis]
MEAAQAASRDIPIQIRSLLCDRCWNEPFSFPNFQKALTSPEESDDRSRGYTYTTPSWKEIDEGENKGCNFCDFLWGDILEYRKSRRDQHLRTEEWPDDDETWRVTLRFGKREEYPHHTFMSTFIGEDMFPSTYEVHTTADDNAASFVPGRNVVWKVSSPECFKFASDDLKDCIANHDCPKPQPTHLPTRVVDCSDPARPRLFVPPNGLQGAYVTLSYVWGQAQPHSTCTTNIDIYINEGIDASLLPQTIKDAIKCTNAIGLRYLWVDTLCIIQDSAEDKNHEISRMCDIYNGAYVTILAACAQKAGDGFLHDRKNPETMDLPFWCPDGRIGRVSVRDQVRAPRDDPVTRRAWCFQEQLLSPRLLIYASHTLQYECQAGIKNVGNANNFLVDEEKEKLRLPQEE